MKIKIAVITTKLLKSHIAPAAEVLRHRCEIDYYIYEEFRQIADIYEEINESYDGICAAGFFIYEIIQRFRKDNQKPVAWVGSSLEEYYKSFFLLQNSNRDLDFSRVVLDAALLNGGKHPKSVLEMFGGGEEMNFEEQKFLLVKNISTERMMNSVSEIIECAERLWREKEIDMVVCRLSSVASELEKRGIPCTFVHPWKQNVQRSLTDFVRELEFSRLDKGLHSVIFITADSLKGRKEGKEEFRKLEECLLQFDREKTAGFLIQKTFGGIEIYTSKQTIDRLTGHFAYCQLIPYLEQQIGMKACVGYGIGMDILQARDHALRACKGVAENGQGALMDENGVLVRLQPCGASDGERGEAVDLLPAAKAAGLSVPTIQKVISAMEILGTSQLTTQELATVLKVSVVNANRVLNSLASSGQAEVISVQKAISHGRPSRVYKVSLLKKEPVEP